MIGICEVHDPQRQTFENVFLIYKTARLPTRGLRAMPQIYSYLGKLQRKTRKKLAKAAKTAQKLPQNHLPRNIKIPSAGYKILCRREQNFFRGTEIYFQASEIYFQAFEIYFKGLEIVFVRAVKKLLTRSKEVVSEAEGSCSRVHI